MFSCKKKTITPNTSGNNTTDTTKTTNQTIGNPGPTITDAEGNKHKKVIIWAQTWMAENLRTSKYSDGSTIPNITDNTQWENNTTGAWCYYKNDAANNVKYGKLYNWYAVSKTTNGIKNVCPTDWLVPTENEWTVLTNYLGGASVAGGKMKEVGTTNWGSLNTDATNVSLFTGLPGGVLTYLFPPFGNQGSHGYWWSSSEISQNTARYRCLSSNNSNSANFVFNFFKKDGFSVRCLMD